MPKIPVIIPVYNTEKYLSRCLDSVIKQTLKDIEIICINDCSLDNSLAILNDYALKDKRIKIINLSQNQGAGKTRNIGIKEAAGEYTGFVDSDDFIDLDFYENLYKIAKEKNAEVAKGNIKTYDNDTKSAKTESRLNINYLVKRNKAHFCFTFTTAIYKTEFIKENNIHFLENFIHFEDPYFTIFAALLYKTVAIIDNVYYYYCNNKNSLTRNLNPNHIKCQIEGTKQILQLLAEHKADKEHYKIVLAYLMEQMINWCNMSDCSDKMTSLAADGLHYILTNCLYLNEVLYMYFTLNKESAKKTLCADLRKRIMVNKNA